MTVRRDAMMGYDQRYYWKKAFALYPGVRLPVSAAPFADHYAGRRAARGPARAALDAAIGLLFHAWVPWRARAVQRKFGLDDQWRRRATALAHAGFADPNDIALFRIPDLETLKLHIRRYEDAAFNKRINPAGWRPDCALADKARFAARCAEAGLPHPETVALVERGAIRILADPAGRALVVKPTDGEGGGGVRLIDPAPDRDALHHALAALPRQGGTLLVQPRVEIHAALRDLALAALPTLRIVTMFDEAGVPEVVSATFRCPTDPAAQVDNMKAGGLIVPVGLESGTLGLACRGYGGGDHAHHPVTGAPIEGRILPDWAEAQALAVRAHARAFSDYALIGWDVAFTPSGPILIEGNGKPGVLMPQRAARAGLAQGRYGALLAHHLKAKQI
jgi:hypothetical protein